MNFKRLYLHRFVSNACADLFHSRLLPPGRSFFKEAQVSNVMLNIFSTQSKQHIVVDFERALKRELKSEIFFRFICSASRFT